MSGTFSGIQTLQFTPDNKKAYAYSGQISVSTEKTLLEFQPNSEYLNCLIEVGAGSRTDDDYKVRFYLDNEVVFLKYMNNTYDPLTGITAFIIPPFSTFKLTLQNQSTGTANTWSANVTAKVGMPPRVGNLVE
tara:strand:- start:371 stop:769 length:399 start_codon:yes stop_codon:yes gene_type:complete